MALYRSPHKGLTLGFEDSTVSFVDGMFVCSGVLQKKVESHSAFGRLFFKVPEQPVPVKEEPVAKVEEPDKQPPEKAEAVDEGGPPDAEASPSAPAARGRKSRVRTIQPEEGAKQ